MANYDVSYANGQSMVDASFGTTVTNVSKASPAIVVAAAVSNTNAALRYFQLFNSATAIAGGAVPVMSFPIAAGSATVPGARTIDQPFFSNYVFNVGLAWGISTTAATYTAATPADHTLNLIYI